MQRQPSVVGHRGSLKDAGFARMIGSVFSAAQQTELHSHTDCACHLAWNIVVVLSHSAHIRVGSGLVVDGGVVESISSPSEETVDVFIIHAVNPMVGEVPTIEGSPSVLWILDLSTLDSGVRGLAENVLRNQWLRV